MWQCELRRRCDCNHSRLRPLEESFKGDAKAEGIPLVHCQARERKLERHQLSEGQPSSSCKNKPRSVGRRKMKMNVRMAFEPTIVLGPVGVEIVENDMNFFLVAVGINDAVHEIQELPSPPPFVMAGLNQASGGF